MNRCAFTLAGLCLALVVFFTPARAAENEYLILIDACDEETYEKVTAVLREPGARALHRYPPEALIARMAPAEKSKMETLPGVSVFHDIVSPSDVKLRGHPGRAAIDAWNILFKNMESPLLAPWTEDAPYWQNEIPDAIELDRGGLDANLNAMPDSPYGADATETSEFFNGSVVVAVITLESNGAAENWTPAELVNVSTEIAQGLNNWITSEPNASLSFTYVYNNQVATTYEPIQGPSTNDVLWMQEGMSALGYTDPNVWTNIYDYANNLRNTYTTDWAYTVFVVDSSADADGLFSDTFCAFAYLGGPAMVMTYDNGAWGITRMDMVMSHETAHIFWALDEYHPVCTNYYPCSTQSGYLWVQNQNCDLNGTGGCLINQNCVMRDNNIANRCAYTRGQIGLTDTDVDTIPDVRDTFPDTTLTPYSPDPTATTTLVYTGQATVVPLSRPGGTGNDISINEIAGVHYRVGGIGTWYPALPVDGIWDEPVEDFTFTIGPLPLATYLVEARCVNNVGNMDASPSQDTVQVVQAPTASFTATPKSGIAPLTVNFGDTTTGYVTAWSWTFGDGGAGTQQNPSHEYTTVGTFTVSLTATGGGVPDTDTQPNLINVTCPGPTAAFTATPTTGEAPLEVTFTDSSSVYTGCDITTWLWDFGDGDTSSEQNPTHEYDLPGAYTVELTVTNAGGADTDTQTDLVTASEAADDDDDDNNDTTDDDDDTTDDDDDDTGSDDDNDTSDDDDSDPSGGDDDDDSSNCCG